MSIIPSGILNTYYTIADEFLNNNLIGQDVTIEYPPNKTACVNCTTSFFGGTSRNVYKPGGPAPFNFGACPLCGGNGYKENIATISIRLRVYWERQNFIKVSTINLDDAELMAIGYISDLIKVKRADCFIIPDDTRYGTNRFKLIAMPFPWGLDKGNPRYFVCFMKKA